MNCQPFCTAVFVSIAVILWTVTALGDAGFGVFVLSVFDEIQAKGEKLNTSCVIGVRRTFQSRLNHSIEFPLKVRERRDGGRKYKEALGLGSPRAIPASQMVNLAEYIHQISGNTVSIQLPSGSNLSVWRYPVADVAEPGGQVAVVDGLLPYNLSTQDFDIYFDGIESCNSAGVNNNMYFEVHDWFPFLAAVRSLHSLLGLACAALWIVSLVACARGLPLPPQDATVRRFLFAAAFLQGSMFLGSLIISPPVFYGPSSGDVYSYQQFTERQWESLVASSAPQDGGFIPMLCASRYWSWTEIGFPVALLVLRYPRTPCVCCGQAMCQCRQIEWPPEQDRQGANVGSDGADRPLLGGERGARARVAPELHGLFF